MSDSAGALFQRCARAWDPVFQRRERLVAGLEEMERALIECRDFRFLHSPVDEIYPFATPLLLPGKLHEEIDHWTGRVIHCLDQIGQWLRSSPHEARDHLPLRSPLDEAFFMLDPGFQEITPIHRLDLILPASGPPQLMEINCGCPGGELDPALVAAGFLSSTLAPQLTGALRCHLGSSLRLDYQDPRDDSLASLLRSYGAFRRTHPSFPKSPTIALITSSAQAHFMVPECRGIARHYRSRGYRTLTGDLLELEPEGEAVLMHGEPVHLVFRKFSTLSFRLRMEKVDRFEEGVRKKVGRIWEAVGHGHLCMVNPLGSTLLQDKGLLETLRDRYPELQPVIPQTFILRPELPSEDPFLWQEIRHGVPFILKRRLSFDGRHVILDPAQIRERAAKILMEAPGQWVAQRRLSEPPYPFAVRAGGGTYVGRFRFNISPFGRGCFVRLGLGSIYDPVNAHRGGAATCTLVISE